MTSAAPTNLDDPPADAPRFLRAFWRLVRWSLPEAFRFFGTYEYRIAQVYFDMAHSTLAVDLQATEDTVAIGLTDIPKVTPWNGLAGSLPNPTSGSRVLVQFVNGNAARPVVVAWAPSGDSGWLPATLALAAVGVTTIGGNTGSPIALAPPLQVWAGQVVSAFGALSPPVTLPALGGSVSATKANAV